MASDVMTRGRTPLRWFELPVFRQVVGIIWLGLWLISLLALFSYEPNDLAHSQYPPNPVPSNFLGWFGANLAWSLYWGFGFGAYLLCLLFFWFFLVNIMGMRVRWIWKPIYTLFFMASACSLLDLYHRVGLEWIQREANVDVPGGLLGAGIMQVTVPYLMNEAGAGLIFGAVCVVSTLLLFDLNPFTTLLGTFSIYRNMKAKSEERRFLRATSEERLKMQEEMLKKREREALEELRRAAAREQKKPQQNENSLPAPGPELLPILVDARKKETTRIMEALSKSQALAKAKEEKAATTQPAAERVEIPAIAFRTPIPSESRPEEPRPVVSIPQSDQAEPPKPRRRRAPKEDPAAVKPLEVKPVETQPLEISEPVDFVPKTPEPEIIATEPLAEVVETAEPVAPTIEPAIPAIDPEPEPMIEPVIPPWEHEYSTPIFSEDKGETVALPDVSAFVTTEPEEPVVEPILPPVQEYEVEIVTGLPEETEETPVEPVEEAQEEIRHEAVVEESPIVETKPADDRFRALHAVEDWMEQGKGMASQTTEPLPTPEPLQTTEPVEEMEFAEQTFEPAEPPAFEPEPEPEPEPAPRPVVSQTMPLPRSSVIHTPPPIEPRTTTFANQTPLASTSDYRLPEVDLLTQPDKNRNPGLSDEQLRNNLDLIVETLRLFGVLAAPGDITPGATITRYEVYPAAGVRVDKISSLNKDLSRVLCAERINVLAPIPGKDSVGIEVPNSNKVAVFLRELLESRDWHSTTAKIPIALGKDVYGKTLVADLADMPHMLIGGTTGSGKSVCINCILMSFLYRFNPEELRLILIDPKQVEMQVYNAIPHLVVPVVTDPKKVMLALKWVINEMEKRYRILAKVGVRNIATFNKRKREQLVVRPVEPQLELSGFDDDDEDEDDDQPLAAQSSQVRVPREDDLHIPDHLPYIVVIVDELADLMQTAPADVESAIARLTAKARAAGIHLIVATQTPRREVVTGIIKTNIPARIAFQVPSGLDSRVILDENGAENLLGRGDLMYKPPGVGRLVRGQGAFVSDDEVAAVVKCCGDQAQAVFNEEIHNKLSGKLTEDISEDDQRLILECFEVIRQEKKASTSNLQRRLRLGYNRAAYVIDFLERTGVVGPGDGARPREILVDLDSYIIEF